MKKQKTGKPCPPSKNSFSACLPTFSVLAYKKKAKASEQLARRRLRARFTAQGRQGGRESSWAGGASQDQRAKSAGDCAGPLGLPCRRSRPLKTRFLHYHTSSNLVLALSDPSPQDTLLSGPILLSLLLRTATALNSNLSPGHPRPRPLFSLALLR